MPDSWVPSGIKYNPPLPVVLERSAWATATKSIGGLVTIQTMEMFVCCFVFFKNGLLLRKKRTIIFQRLVKNLFQGLGPSKHLVAFRELITSGCFSVMLPTELPYLYERPRTGPLHGIIRVKVDVVQSCWVTWCKAIRKAILDQTESSILPWMVANSKRCPCCTFPASSLQLLRESLIRSQLVGV